MIGAKLKVALLYDAWNEDPVAAAAPAEPFWKEGGTERTATPPAGAPGSFADLAEHVSPAVVNIQTKKTLNASSGRHPLEDALHFHRALLPPACAERLRPRVARSESPGCRWSRGSCARRLLR